MPTDVPVNDAMPVVSSPPGELLSDELADELLAGARTPQELTGPGGLLARLTKRLIERAMSAGLEDHLGYPTRTQSPPREKHPKRPFPRPFAANTTSADTTPPRSVQAISVLLMRQQRFISVIAIGCSCLALVACAGSSHKSKQSAATTSSAIQSAQPNQEGTSALASLVGLSPQKVLARVGPKAITVAAVEHLMALNSAQAPLPDPPSYAGCIARAKAAGATTASAAGGQSEAQLRQSCQQSYQKLLQSSLGAAIHVKWLIGQAAEERISVSPQEVRQEFDLSKKQFRTEAEFDAYRKSTGQSVADMMSEIKLSKLTDKIFQNIKKKEHPPSSAQVAAYYDAHRQQYAVPEGRDLRIVRAATQASALKAKQEIQAGKSFASVVKELSAIAQPITSKNGQVRDLKPQTFEERALKGAIFGAQLHRLYGPLKVTNGHPIIAAEASGGVYVFEVTATVPGAQTPLSQVKNAIAQQLAKTQGQRTLAASIAAFKAKWRARTDCQPGFVVRNCRQSKASEQGVGGDPYTL